MLTALQGSRAKLGQRTASTLAGLILHVAREVSEQDTDLIRMSS